MIRSRLMHRFIPCLIVSIMFFSTLSPQATKAADNGLAVKPILGWSSWSAIRQYPSEDKIKTATDTLAATFRSHGYRYVNVDDFYQVDWSKTVDTYGRWVVDPIKFPNGMKVLGDYIHSKGLKFGLYITPGIPKAAVDQNTPIEGTPYHAQDIANTSKMEINYNFKNMYYINYNKPGAQEFINSWARLFASYGVDFLKLDGVGDWDIPDIEAWAKALRSTGRAIHLELSNHLPIRYACTWKALANGWRTDYDVESSSGTLTDWKHVALRFDSAANWAKFAGPGGWNDFDSINVANGSHDGLTQDEKQSHVTLWAIGASHFYMGSDLTKLDTYGVSLLTNDEVLAVNQSGVAGKRLFGNEKTQVFYQKLPGGIEYVALFNTGSKNTELTLSLSDFGILGKATARDLWTHTDLGEYTNDFSVDLAPHASKLLKIMPATDNVP